MGINKSNNSILNRINNKTDKIDGLATNGLEGIRDSLAYRIHEVMVHVHSDEIWFETATTPNGEVHVADEIGDGNGAFQMDAGNDDWGSWVQILGSSDTPFRVEQTSFDLNGLEVEATERALTYFIQITRGATGAVGLNAGDYISFPYIPISKKDQQCPFYFRMKRINSGTKVWARCKCSTQNTGTLDFYFGLHEYNGV